MIKCPECQTQISALSICCPFCGHPINTLDDLYNDEFIICSECGSKNDINGNFCNICGMPISKKGVTITEQRENERALGFYEFLKKLKKSSIKDIKDKMKDL